MPDQYAPRAHLPQTFHSGTYEFRPSPMEKDCKISMPQYADEGNPKTYFLASLASIECIVCGTAFNLSLAISLKALITKSTFDSWLIPF